MDFSLQYSLANDSGVLKQGGITLTKLYKRRGCVEMLLQFQSFKSLGRSVWQSNKETLHRKEPMTTSICSNIAYARLYSPAMNSKVLHKQKLVKKKLNKAPFISGSCPIFIINEANRELFNSRLPENITSQSISKAYKFWCPFSCGLTIGLAAVGTRMTLVLVCARG